MLSTLIVTAALSWSAPTAVELWTTRSADCVLVDEFWALGRDVLSTEYLLFTISLGRQVLERDLTKTEFEKYVSTHELPDSALIDIESLSFPQATNGDVLGQPSRRVTGQVLYLMRLDAVSPDKSFRRRPAVLLSLDLWRQGRAVIPGIETVPSDFIHERDGEVHRLHLPLYWAYIDDGVRCRRYLAERLPGAMMEQELRELGYSDTSRYELIVQLLSYEVRSETAYLFNPARSELMSKKEFDDWLESVQQEE